MSTQHTTLAGLARQLSSWKRTLCSPLKGFHSHYDMNMQVESHVTAMPTRTSVDPAAAAGLVTLVLALVFSCRGVKQGLPMEARNCGQEERCTGRLSGRLHRLAARLHAITVVVATRHALLPQCQDPSPEDCPCFAEQMAFLCIAETVGTAVSHTRRSMKWQHSGVLTDS